MSLFVLPLVLLEILLIDLQWLIVNRFPYVGPEPPFPTSAKDVMARPLLLTLDPY